MNAMDAIEFQTSIKNGTIQIPQQYQRALKDISAVKVVVEISEKKISENGIIARLRENPKVVKDFEFMTREETHDRSL